MGKIPRVQYSNPFYFAKMFRRKIFGRWFLGGAAVSGVFKDKYATLAKRKPWSLPCWALAVPFWVRL